MIFRQLLAGALAALAFSACTKVGDTGASEAAATSPAADAAGGGHADRLVIATAADPRNLNPAFATAIPVLQLSSFLFSYTVRYDERSRPVPDAVTEIPTVANGDVSRDGLTVKYKLRRNMKWHDGQPVTCRDLRFTWQVMINRKITSNTTDGWRDIKAVDCTDPYVAVVHMKRVYAAFLQQLWSVNGNGPIMPEHLLAREMAAKGNLNESAYNSAPVGSGPYKFVEWTRGSEVRLAANPEFYLGKPKIAEVVYKIIPDQNTLATQVQTHEVDVAWNMSPAAYEIVKKRPGVRLITPVVYQWDHIDFNLRRPIFADVRVRRALTYALDRPTLLSKLRHGLGELSSTFLDPTLYPDAQTSRVVVYPYNVAKANALLDEAGWHRGSDGVRVRDGVRLAFQISTATESSFGQRIEQQAQNYWHTIGAAVEVKNYPTPLFFDNSGATGILAGGKYDVATYVWSGAADIDNSALYSADNIAPHGQNYLFWKNAVATAAMNDANRTIDQKRRIADYATVQEEFSKDDPSIILWFRRDVETYPTALENFTSTPVILTPFWNPWTYAF